MPQNHMYVQYIQAAETKRGLCLDEMLVIYEMEISEDYT